MCIKFLSNGDRECILKSDGDQKCTKTWKKGKSAISYTILREHLVTHHKEKLDEIKAQEADATQSQNQAKQPKQRLISDFAVNREVYDLNNNKKDLYTVRKPFPEEETDMLYELFACGLNTTIEYACGDFLEQWSWNLEKQKVLKVDGGELIEPIKCKDPT